MRKMTSLPAELTREERQVIAALNQAYNRFAQLPTEHPADLSAFYQHVYAAQAIVLARAGHRAIRGQAPIPAKGAVGFGRVLGEKDA